MKTQRQRANERRKRDHEDSVASCKRADSCCEACGKYAPYGTSIYSGQNHHDKRKSTHPHLRHEKSNHFWLCNNCHRAAHDRPNNGHAVMHTIQKRRDGQ